ncbi:MAG TPA: DMT family transporter [Verrucomicrobiae bacterium]|nr:DMT family transporter [Verrucomicrobiae bacterium]
MTQNRYALPGLLIGALLIGFAPIFVRLIDVGHTAAGFWRVFLALPLLALALTPEIRSSRVAPKARIEGTSSVKWLLFAGVFFAADLAVWHQSIRYTSVANSTLLANLCPVFVTAGSVLWLGEKITRGFVAGLALALLGSALLVASSFSVSLQTVIGDALGVAAAVMYTGYLLIVSRERQRASTASVMWWSSVAAAVLLLPGALLMGESIWPQSARGWWVLIGLALSAQVFGQGLIAWAMAHLPASFSSVSLLVQPVAATLLAWLLLGESFGGLQALGGVVVLAGILTCRLTMVARVS